MIVLRIQYCLGLHGGLWSGLSVVHGGLHYLYERLPEWSWKEADSMLCALLVTWLLLDLDCWCLPLPLHPLDVLQDHLSPPPDCLDLHWVLKWFLFPHLWHFLPHAGHSLGGWDVPHLPHILPLLLVLGSSPRSLAFSCEGSDLVDCGRCCNSSIGLVSVKVLDGCFMLFCMLQ